MVRLVGVTSSMGPCTMLPNTHTTLQMEWNGDRKSKNIKNKESMQGHKWNGMGTAGQVKWNGDSTDMDCISTRRDKWLLAVQMFRSCNNYAK